MDSNDSSEPDSDLSSEPDSDLESGPEILDYPRTAGFFAHADHISSAKKPDFPLSLESTPEYRVPSEICKKCQRVILRISQVFSTGSTFGAGEHHQTYAAVKSSADDGCGICSIFFREFRFERIQKDKRDIEGETSWISANGTSFTWILTIPWIEGDPNPKAIQMENGDPEYYYAFQASIESFQAVSQSLDYDSSRPNTRDALPLCKIWLENCRKSHMICTLPQYARARTGPMVERFIDVSNWEPRLCLSEELEPNRPYAALSHCWGSLSFTTLKKDNLSSFQQRIPPDALTKTFRDAIDICRYLDIPYLWIDSLCIIQDSTEDWATQSALMAHIYGECDLNIAATSAEHGNVGCFLDRPKNWNVQIRPLPEREDILYDCLPHPLLNPEKDVLNQRGWVVQERYLSRRTLHFTANEVFWECDGLSACETCPGGNPTRATPFCEYGLKRRGINRTNWDNLVTQYSGARLTQASNRLIAIEGLARAVEANTSDRYVAGMWQEWIERQLAWSPSEEFRPIANKLAPSWSWASGIGRVSLPLVWFDGTGNNPLYVALEDLQTEYVSENTFRDVKSALLRLRCTHLLRAELEPVGDSPADVYYKAKFGDQRFDDGLYLKIDNPDMAAKVQIIPAYVLVVDESRGILLQPTFEGAGQYRRIGSYLAMENDFVKAMAFADCIEQRELEAFSSVMEDEDENEIYIIDLV